MADAGVGEAAAAEGAKSAGEATAVDAGAAGAADVGAGAGLGAAAGIGNTAIAGAGLGADAVGTGAGLGAAEGLGDAALSGSNLGADAIGAGGGLTALAPSVGADTLPSLAGAGIGDVAGIGVDAMPSPAAFGALPDTSSVGTLGSTSGINFGTPTFADQLSGAGNKALTWAENNPAQAALLGISGFNVLHTPALPSAAQTALGSSTQAVEQAQGILASGGTSSPLWASSKASIDQNIDAQLKNATEALMQNAANSGMGGANSAVVQQQINSMRQQAETQRQTMYNQTLQQIVSQAVSELSGGNQTLGSIAQMQMSQSAQAQQAASQTAELALLLGGSKSGASTQTPTGS